VEPEDPHLDEFEDDEWVNLLYAENTTSEFNRSTTPTATENLKVRNIFESKINYC